MPWNLFRKAALVLFVAALLIGFGATALFMGGHFSRETWRIVFILALVVLTITSTILTPRVLIPNLQSPHPEFLADDLEDEWRDLQQRRIARPHILLMSGAIAALAYLWAILYYGKLTNASGLAGSPSARRRSSSPSSLSRSSAARPGTPIASSARRPG